MPREEAVERKVLLRRLRGVADRIGMTPVQIEDARLVSWAARELEVERERRKRAEKYRCCNVTRTGKHQADCPRILHASASEARERAEEALREIVRAAEAWEDDDDNFGREVDMDPDPEGLFWCDANFVSYMAGQARAALPQPEGGDAHAADEQPLRRHATGGGPDGGSAPETSDPPQPEGEECRTCGDTRMVCGALHEAPNGPWPCPDCQSEGTNNA